MSKKINKDIMKKTARIKIIIARFGYDPEKLEVSANTTVEEALKETSIILTNSEKVWVNGDKATLKDILEEGDNVLIVSPKEAGA